MSHSSGSGVGSPPGTCRGGIAVSPVAATARRLLPSVTLGKVEQKWNERPWAESPSRQNPSHLGILALAGGRGRCGTRTHDLTVFAVAQRVGYDSEPPSPTHLPGC
jgi:hypothetical protein